MRVKRLEIQGFKSFKDKTVIHFDHSITGIVGPNGCGKSNIVDAFFWVMGEQSYKHMRGSSSEDLIFNGSSKYPSLGLAEATLVMETDVEDRSHGDGATVQDLPVHLRAKEVAVTRRVYRTGEGEYFINGLPARLKDIQELFMDTGVGAKGYSVIEQGQIGKIVNAKPEERRLLIEEAAGIAKYKARKKESLRKMEATNGNLSRLTDVLQEIERNLESLERQAQKARLHKKYKAELDEKEMTWGRRKAKVVKQKIEALQQQREVVEQELLALRTELQSTENSIESDRATQLTASKQAEELQARVQVLSDDLTRQQSALDLSRRRQGDLNDQLQNAERERVELERAIETDRERVEEKQALCEEFQCRYAEVTEDAQEKDARVRALRSQTEEARTQLHQAKRQLMDAVNRSSDLTSRAASMAARKESADAQAARLSTQAEQAQQRVDQAREEAEKAQAAATELRERLETLRQEKKTQAALVQEQDQNLRRQEHERTQADRQLTQLRSKLQSLEELAASHEGFGDGPKAALEWARDNGKGERVRAIADIVNVDHGYEAAAHGWLEDRLEDLLTEDAETGLAMLDSIREQKQGRARVHLADVASGKAASWAEVQKFLTDGGFEVEGELSKFVRPGKEDGEFSKNRVGTLVRQVCVVKSLSGLAAFLASPGAERLRTSGWSLVDREGSAYDASGILRGGCLDATGSASLVIRRRTIEELKSEVATAEQALQALVAACDEARMILETARTRLDDLQSELQSLEVQTAAMERDVHQTGRALREVESQLAQAERDAATAREEAQRADTQREQAETELRSLSGNREELERSISESETQQQTLEEALRAGESQLQSVRIEEASLRERLESARREVDGLASLLADRERRRSDVARTLERASTEREQFTGGDAELETKIEDLIRTLDGSRQQLSSVKAELEIVSKRLSRGLDRIKELHSAGDQKTSDSTQVALEIEKHNSDLAHLVQNLEEKYGVGCLERPVTGAVQEEMNEPVVTAEMTAEEEQALGELVERLRERLRRLGEVNLMAIEDYEQLKKRYDHLVNEKGDLERSLQNLQDAIDHINKTSEDRFSKAFDAIAERFERLFPIIFGGGQARLSLIYPEGSNDILEAGVDILAQPPGKKVANITLLSGGEKALTAVSLIFAIFMVKPSPFCILDEVDAPLDDANIGKFNGLLREMSAKSQFILITHNKRTMELNDTLYGVTMEEPGVSRMVSIEMH